MNAEQIEEIRKRAEAATAGPWGVEESRYSGSYNVGIVDWSSDFSACLCPKNDAEFIAHAREDVPALLAEVERLQKELEWYADMANYTANETSCDGLPAIDNDYGRRARRALGLKGADE